VRFAIVVVLALAACGSTPPPAPRSFVAPGPLIAGHAALTCIDCHAGASPAIEPAKCTGCHAAVATGKGLHASAIVRGKACSACHRDHRGARFDALGWPAMRGGRTGFDHDLTGWPLAGAHRSARCETCHTATSPLGRTTFLGAERRCEGCHADQPHGFERPALLACGRCHTAAAWSPPKRVLAFDHGAASDARVPVVGAHGKLACARCHPASRFALELPEPAACESCHESPHTERPYGAVACATCHSPASFALIARFDHARFDPNASHRGLACAGCHTSMLASRVPSAACESCHAAKSPHADRFKAFGKPARCATCHAPTTVGTWKPNRFDHAKQGGWRLERFHAQTTCRACHRGATPAAFERLPGGKSCTGCHAHKTVHADEDHPTGKFSNAQCLQCHTY
jgi:hypothetical protein